MQFMRHLYINCADFENDRPNTYMPYMYLRLAPTRTLITSSRENSQGASFVGEHISQTPYMYWRGLT
jgi:hypothetical protein